jgi:hypothetical protein
LDVNTPKYPSSLAEPGERWRAAKFKVLIPLVISIAAMRVENVPAWVRQHRRTFLRIDVDESDQPLITQMIERVVPWIRGRVANVVQVTLRNDAKCANGGEHPGIFAIEFVQVLPLVLNKLALQAAREVEAVDERIARIAIAGVHLSVALVAIARVLAPAWVVNVIAVTVTGVRQVTRIEIEHVFSRYQSTHSACARLLLQWLHAHRTREGC